MMLSPEVTALRNRVYRTNLAVYVTRVNAYSGGTRVYAICRPELRQEGGATETWGLGEKARGRREERRRTGEKGN